MHREHTPPHPQPPPLLVFVSFATGESQAGCCRLHPFSGLAQRRYSTSLTRLVQAGVWAGGTEWLTANAGLYLIRNPSRPARAGAATHQAPPKAATSLSFLLKVSGLSHTSTVDARSDLVKVVPAGACGMPPRSRSSLALT